PTHRTCSHTRHDSHPIFVTMVVRRLGGLSGVHGDLGLAAVQGAELAAVAGLTGVLLALDRSRHGEPPGAGVHRWKWAASAGSYRARSCATRAGLGDHPRSRGEHTHRRK